MGGEDGTAKRTRKHSAAIGAAHEFHEFERALELHKLGGRRFYACRAHQSEGQKPTLRAGFGFALFLAGARADVGGYNADEG